MLSKIATLSKILIAYVCRGLAYFSPRSRQIWIFTGWHSNGQRQVFADNSKYMFLYVANQDTYIKAIWIAEDKHLAKILRDNGYLAYSINSLYGIYYSLRAGYTFVDAFMKLTNWQYASGSQVTQLWHGKGMKKTGHDSPYSLKRYNKMVFPNLFVIFDKLIASSNYTAKLMESTFKVAEDKILITGLPRNDVLHHDILGAEIDSHTELGKVISEAKSQGRQKIILYAPTFRPDGSNPMETFEFATANDWLEKKDWHLVISLHPKFAQKESLDTKNFTHISSVGAGYDVYPQLKEVDILVTDYSSLYVDFLQLDKPIIFYTYDLETYQQEMGLHDDFINLTPGPHSKTFSDLLLDLSQNDNYSKARQEVRQILHKYEDDDSAKRIFETLAWG